MLGADLCGLWRWTRRMPILQAMTEASIRLFLDHPLTLGQPVPLDQAQAHYLFNVMRRGPGDALLGFNGRDGEWLLRITEAGKKAGIALPERQTRPQLAVPDLWLIFAPVKKARTDFIVEKAVEMGVTRILPVQTDHTNSERIRQDRLEANAREAAEQCGALAVPPVEELQSLSALLDRWPEDRQLAFCDEAAEAGSFAAAGSGAWAILIGPEGGFSQRERARLLKMPRVTRVSLGPRILRAETAAIAALTLWQSQLGDWK